MIKNICLFDTPYSLALYMLKMPMKEIMRTKFISGGNISSIIVERLPNNCAVYNGNDINNNWIKLFKVRFGKYLKFPYFLWSNIYAQDHLYMSPQIIGCRKYTLVADNPNCFQILSKIKYEPTPLGKGKNWKQKLKYLIVYRGTTYGYKFGTHSLCTNRWVAKGDSVSPYLESENYELVDLQYLWDCSSSEKKEFIKNIFGIDDNLLSHAQRAEALVLTQPLKEDCGLTDEEYISVYSNEISKYTNVIIKPHPRDKFDFEKYFPNIIVLRTPAPMQLLNYMGVMPKVAITVSSTAIYSMPSSVKKVILGTKAHPKIYAVLGDSVIQN